MRRPKALARVCTSARLEVNQSVRLPVQLWVMLCITYIARSGRSTNQLCRPCRLRRWRRSARGSGWKLTRVTQRHLCRWAGVDASGKFQRLRSVSFVECLSFSKGGSDENWENDCEKHEVTLATEHWMLDVTHSVSLVFQWWGVLN